MLIIPAENSVNWKRPPWVTLGLILVCLLVFLFYQGGDDRKLESALDQYLERGLLAVEAPACGDYRQREIRFEGGQQRVLEWQEFQQLREQDNDLWQAATLLLDRELSQYLRSSRDIIW